MPLTSLEEAAPEFTVTAYSDPHPGDVSHRAVGVFPIGAGALVPEANARTLIQLLAEEKPVDAIVNKAVATLRAVAADPKAADAVSADCMVVVLDPDRGIAPTEHFSPKGSVAEKLVWPSRVAVRSDMPGFQLTDLIVTPPAAILLLPAPGEPCHCGSGRKYKDCHGRQTRKGPR